MGMCLTGCFKDNKPVRLWGSDPASYIFMRCYVSVSVLLYNCKHGKNSFG
jgi:hypothetical protein